MTSVPVPRGLRAVFDAELATAVQSRLAKWERERFGRRLWAKDQTLWAPEGTPEIADRLGWLDLPRTSGEHVQDWKAFALEVASEGFTDVVLLGMGGSSLAPEVFQATFGNAPGQPPLTVLDSTHPAAVAAVTDRLNIGTTLFIVSSKSGTTIETVSLYRYFWDTVGRARHDRGRAFVAITDPGTALERMGRDLGFRRVFAAPADVGGRYSALSAFGLVPAALIGVDIARLLEKAVAAAARCGPGVPAFDSPGLSLGAASGEAALRGHDKLTFSASPALSVLPAWIEQLIAESTGKNGKGIIPVVGEPARASTSSRRDRFFIALSSTGSAGGRGREPGRQALAGGGHPVVEQTHADTYDLGGTFFVWEVATAAAGAVLGIHPFDQPDVQVAKDLARDAMTRGGARAGGPPPVRSDDAAALARATVEWLRRPTADGYIAVQAYLPPGPQIEQALQDLRASLADAAGLATTLGYGPRFLHSTGQLHKGGPNVGLFLQIIDEPVKDLEVPESGYTFGALIAAQAAGDALALMRRGRRLLRVNVGRSPVDGVRLFTAAVRAAAP